MESELSADAFWEGEYGEAYLRRNDRPELLESKRRFFEKNLVGPRFFHPSRVIEFGSNIGLNLRALRLLGGFTMTDFTGVDINRLAIPQLEGHGFVAHHASIADPGRPWGSGYDLALSMGLLIHIEPARLPHAYAALYDAVVPGGLVFIGEYFSATRRRIEYRGHKDKLWLADYGGEFWDQYPDLECIDVGFAWKRDPVAPQDDVTFWTFRKPGAN